MGELVLTNPEPDLKRPEWRRRFIARMIQRGGRSAMKMDYARHAASAYWPDRNEYGSPEEAADADMSEWS